RRWSRRAAEHARHARDRAVVQGFRPSSRWLAGLHARRVDPAEGARGKSSLVTARSWNGPANTRARLACELPIPKRIGIGREARVAPESALRKVFDLRVVAPGETF